jgi:hypothetical protein
VGGCGPSGAGTTHSLARSGKSVDRVGGCGQSGAVTTHWHVRRGGSGRPVPSGRVGDRAVAVRAVGWTDWWWLTRAGSSPELVGRQYHWIETPLQLFIAPGRATLGPRGPAGIIEVDGERAGYIGRNPLSGNLEYFVKPWARGGVGKRAIVAFLRDHRAGDRSRRFFVSHKNDRSRAALLGAFAELGWAEGDQYTVRDGRHGSWIEVGPGPQPASPSSR